MMRTLYRMFLPGVAIVVFALSLVGCSSETPPATPDQAASFKGGPMPPEARAKMEEAMQNARNKAMKDASTKKGP